MISLSRGEYPSTCSPGDSDRVSSFSRGCGCPVFSLRSGSVGKAERESLKIWGFPPNIPMRKAGGSKPTGSYLPQRRGGFGPEGPERCQCFTAAPMAGPKYVQGFGDTIFIMSRSQPAADQAGCQDLGSRSEVWATMSQRPGKQ